MPRFLRLSGDGLARYVNLDRVTVIQEESHGARVFFDGDDHVSVNAASAEAIIEAIGCGGGEADDYDYDYERDKALLDRLLAMDATTSVPTQ